MSLSLSQIADLLGDEAESLLSHTCKAIPKERLYLRSGDFVDQHLVATDRPAGVLVNYQRILDHGRLAGTGYVSILPVDQGVEHSGGASFAPNPDYFDPAKIVELAIEGGCNAVATTYGVLSHVSRKYAHRIPLILKFNHNELLTVPNTFDQVFFAQIEQAAQLGCAGVGATIYYGSEEASRQITEVSEAFDLAHDLGMVTILWCYLRNPAFKKDKDYHASADLTGQAIHLGVTIGADIVKQKQATCNYGYKAMNYEGSSYGKFSDDMYELMTDNPIDWTRYQVANAYMGRVGVINSGGSSGQNDLAQAVRTAVINKRGGGMGLISGRKSFQKPMADGVELLNAIQDVFLNDEVTVA